MCVCVRQHRNRIYVKITSEALIHRIDIVHVLIVIVLILIIVIIVDLLLRSYIGNVSNNAFMSRLMEPPADSMSRMSGVAGLELSRRWRHMTDNHTDK